MQVDEAIIKRRSIRKYTDKFITDDSLKKILEAGTWAPSGLNNQPWRFNVIKEKSKKDKLASFTKYHRIIEDAPLAVCIFLDKEVMYDRDKDILAVGACCQNMLLKAHSLGIGTCWLGEILNQKEQVREFLGISQQHELMAVITLGYPAEEPAPGKRNRPAEFLLD